MARDLTAPQLAAVQAKQVYACVFVQLDYASVLRVSNLPFPMTWGGATWTGLGDLGSVEPIYETATNEVKGASMTLSGVPNELIATTLAEDYQGKRCQIWYALLDESQAIIGSPVRIFFGRIDTMVIESGEDSSVIKLTAEPPNVDWQRPRGGRFNHEDQQARYPGDRGLEYVADMVNVEILWGKT